MNSPLYHSVYFWLHDGGDPADTQRFVEGCRTYLSGIPGMVQMSVGVPAGTPGGPVDNSYGVALLIEFESKDAAQVYEEHPDHQRFIGDFHHLWSRVQVYDAVPA